VELGAGFGCVVRGEEETGMAAGGFRRGVLGDDTEAVGDIDNGTAGGLGVADEQSGAEAIHGGEEGAGEAVPSRRGRVGIREAVRFAGFAAFSRKFSAHRQISWPVAPFFGDRKRVTLGEVDPPPKRK
jgi:hypothetical protein